ncbi:MAG: hypothetical protein ACK4OP_04880 [Gemmobacter sp.]
MPVQAKGGLSLGQRRGIATYEAEILPGLIARLTEAAGKPIPVEIDYPAIAVPEINVEYTDPTVWTDIYFEPLIAALAAVAADALGREAVAAGVTGIRLTYDPRTAPLSNYPEGLRFEDGVLTLNFRPYANPFDIDERAKAIRTLLESRL